MSEVCSLEVLTVFFCGISGSGSFCSYTFLPFGSVCVVEKGQWRLGKVQRKRGKLNFPPSRNQGRLPFPVSQKIQGVSYVENIF